MGSSLQPHFGYMNVHLEKLESEAAALRDETSFIEIQLHDRLKSIGLVYGPCALPDSFRGYITIHGEGETDGKRRLEFTSPDHHQRSSYVDETLKLFNKGILSLGSRRIKRLILHPDSNRKGESRERQIKFLAQSLEEMRDGIPNNIEVCIEP